jgi:hypothetical protein
MRFMIQDFFLYPGRIYIVTVSVSVKSSQAFIFLRYFYYKSMVLCSLLGHFRIYALYARSPQSGRIRPQRYQLGQWLFVGVDFCPRIIPFYFNLVCNISIS